jgi:hypothetical protein
VLKKKWFFCLFFTLSLFISGCSTPSHEIYKGDSLRIGVVGKAPEVEDKNIFFSDINLEDLKNETLSVNADHDAVFIMPEELIEADSEKYVEVYQQLNIPTFFIGTMKATIPFTFKDAIYNDVADVSPKTYAAGYLYDPENELGETWRFTKEKDDEKKITEKEIEIIYSDIFSTINSIN